MDNLSRWWKIVFFMKVPSCAIEDAFTASRRCLHSPTKVSSFFLLAQCGHSCSKILQGFRLMPDSPIANVGTVWRLKSPMDAMSYASVYLTNDDLEAVLISFDKFVKDDLYECNLYHSFRSFSKEFVIDGQPSEVFQP